MYTPFKAYGASVSRIILGAIQAPASSVITGSWYYWCLRSELTKLNAVFQVGTAIGLICVGVIAGAMLSWSYHWHHVFYFMSVIYFIGTIFFLIKGDDTPQNTHHSLNFIRPWRLSTRISEKELNLLIADRPPHADLPAVPWLKIIGSLDVWLFLFAWLFPTGMGKTF